jgi:signal transduction histidine kinase
MAELDVETVLARLLDTARKLTGARYAAIGVLDPNGPGLERFVTTGVDAETHRAIGDLPRGRGVLGVLIDDPRPLRLAHVGTHPHSYGFPASHPVMESFLGVPILIRGKAWGNLYLTETPKGEFGQDDEDAIVVLAAWAAIAIENARLYESAEGQRTRLEQAVEGLEATTAIARAVGSETDLRRILELIVKRGRALVQARSLIVLLSDGESLGLASAAGQVDPHALGMRMPVAGTVAGEVAANGRAERIADVAARFGPADEGFGVIGAETALVVPLVYRGRPLGVLAAFDRLTDDAQFSDRDEELLLAFAASAATAVATARSVEQERLRHSLHSAEGERRRWARELHDETLQGLGGLQVLLASGLRAGGDALERSTRQAVEQLGTEIANLRSLITELRPAALDELGLAPAIESLVQRVRTVEGLEVDLDLDLDLGGDGGRLEPDRETAAYRLVQEALTNVAKHAGAEHVHVRVADAPGGIEVQVDDDGRGFDPEQPAGGFGLVGLRERAELLGGTVAISSSPAGTTVRAFLPDPSQISSWSSA